MSNLMIRALSGTLYVALIVLSLIFSDLYFCILCLIFGVLATVELSELTAYDRRAEQPAKRSRSVTTMGLDVFGIMSLTLPAIGVCLNNTETGMLLFLVAGLTMWGLYAVMRLYAAVYQKDGFAVTDISHSMLTQVYLGMGLVCAQYLSLQSTGLVLLVFILIWINDTGAYLVGSAFGKLKLCPRLSPGKSWEGFFGGLFLGIAVSIALWATGTSAQLLYYPIFGPWEVTFILPIVVGVTGTLGDLFESMIKRSVGAKDSGTLIPGHGGILDRIDSMLFAMPATYILILLCSLID